MTDNQKLVEGWAFEFLRISAEVDHDKRDELHKLVHMARLGAWYHKHQVMIDNILHTAIQEMEAANHPTFFKSIDQVRAIVQDKPQETI